MRIATFFMVWGLLQVSAKTSAQLISLSGKNLPLMDVLKEIRQQSGYDFIFAASALEHARPVSMDIRELPLKEALRQVFAHQPLSYDITDRSVTVWMNAETGTSRPDVNGRAQGIKKTPSEGFVLAYPEVRGRVVDSLGQPLAGASVRVINAQGKRTTLQTKADRDGYFELRNVPEDARLEVTFVGHIKQELKAKPDMGAITLELVPSALEEVEVVVSTGYQQLPKERATGSFSYIDNKTFNQQVGPTIMERLETIANGVVVDRTYSSTPNFMVRGLSTIQGPREVLIVVDNFPYEGDINNINPNDVQDITILKDAAAASIWGARAGNGVIVITTKQGRFNQSINTSLNTNVTISEKPNLHKIPQINSGAFIEYEKFLYEQGYFDSKINAKPSTSILSPVVELLIKRDHAATESERPAIDAAIESYKSADIRDDMLNYLYRPLVNQQYAFNMTGGSDQLAWAATANYDRNIDELHATYNRINLNYKSTFRPAKNLEITSGIYYTQSGSKSGAEGYGRVKQISNGFYPYTRIADDEGNPVGILKSYREAWTDTLYPGKLLDWKYYPLTDYKHNYTTTKIQDMVFKGGVKYRLFSFLAADVKYQFERQNQTNNNLWGVESYTMRSQINMYSQVKEDGSVEYGYPYGGRFTFGNNVLESHQWRGQLNIDKQWDDHQVVAILGNEVRMMKATSNGGGVYGYDEELLTYTRVNYDQQIRNIMGTGYTTLQDLTATINDKSTRFISLFGNAAYTFKSKYTLSLSARRDASNLFGLKVNDQWNPFFSAGVSWNVSDEQFYRLDWLPRLKVRTTYGISGNVDPAMTAVTTIAYVYSNSYTTNQRQASFNNYFNPELRWETPRQFNAGIDFATSNNRVSGSIEYFYKHGINLFGNALLDYTAGVGASITKNIASMKGRGVDFDLNFSLVDRPSFDWNAKLNFSIYNDRLVDYYLSSTRGGDFISIPASRQGRPTKVGLPVNSVLSYKWGGLDPQTGDPIGYLNGEPSKDYRAIYFSTTVDDLVFHGSSIPTKYGSLINSVAYKNFELNVGVSFKLGYYFRRETADFENIARQAIGHNDFEKRWQKPGDEKFTTVPSIQYPFPSYRQTIYERSEALVEKGDHVRLQYIQLNYNLARQNFPKLPFRDVRFYANANNLGIIWRANKRGVDPDVIYGYENYALPMVSSFSFGLSVNISK